MPTTFPIFYNFECETRAVFVCMYFVGACMVVVLVIFKALQHAFDQKH